MSSIFWGNSIEQILLSLLLCHKGAEPWYHNESLVCSLFLLDKFLHLLNKTVEIFLEKLCFPSVNSTFFAIFFGKKFACFFNVFFSGKRKKKTLLVWVGKISY